MLGGPIFHRTEERHQRLAGVGQLVLDTRRYFGEDGAVHDATRLEFPEIAGQRLLAHLVDLPTELAESERSAVKEEGAQDQELVAAAQ